MKTFQYATICFAAAVITAQARGPHGGGDDHDHHDSHHDHDDHHHGPPQDVIDACSDDVDTLCADLDPRETRECMKENWDDVSDDCKSAIEEHMPKPPAVCVEDFAELCPDLEGEELKECIKENWDDVNDDCQEAIKDKHRGGRHPPPAECKDEFDEVCPDLEGKEKFECVKDSWDDLSDDCKEAIKEQKKHHHHHRPAVVKACKDDVEELCPDLEGEELKECMTESWEEVSDECKDAIKKHHRGEDDERDETSGHEVQELTAEEQDVALTAFVNTYDDDAAMEGHGRRKFMVIGAVGVVALAAIGVAVGLKIRKKKSEGSTPLAEAIAVEPVVVDGTAVPYSPPTLDEDLIV